MHNLGERIRQIRKWRGFSQSEVEEKSGIKREYLSKLENNDLKNPTYSTLLKISSALGIPLTSLISAVDKPLPHKEPVIKVVAPQEGAQNAGNNYVAVPIVNEELAALNPLYLGEQDVKDYALVPHNWLEETSDPNRYRCLRMGKDNRAMHPLLCCDSIVCYDTYQTDPHKLQKQMVVMRNKEGKVFVRHLKIGDGYIIAIPENLKEYCLHIFPLDKESPVIGKVIWYLQQVKSCQHG